MPIVAVYQHRLVREATEPWGDPTDMRYRVGRTQLYVWVVKYKPLLPQLRRFLAEDIKAAPRDLRPDPYTPVWSETVGDYPPGSPYDFPCPA